MSLTAPPDSWPRISHSWSRRWSVRFASHQMPTVRKRVKVSSGRVRPRRAMSSSCCEVMDKLPVVPLRGARFELLISFARGSTGRNPSDREHFCLRSSNWLADGGTNHFLRAACPAFVLAWITDRNGEIIASPVIARLRTGRTLGVVVPARLAPRFSDVVEDGELFAVGIEAPWRQLDRGWFTKKLVGNGHATTQPCQFCLGEFLQAFEIGQLRGDVAGCVIEPVAVVVGAMDSERAPEGIAELPWPEFVLAREDLNTVSET